MKNSQIYDVLILGAGPAGLTAAIYCLRYNLRIIIISKANGSMMHSAGDIENWPGFIGPASELIKKFEEQAKKFGAEFLLSEIKSVEKTKKDFVIKTDSNEIYGKSLILALGTEHNKLGIPGEKEFVGRGVSYCTICDGFFFKNKIVAVIGGGDSAAKSALYLSEIAKKVYLIVRKDKLKCEPILSEKISQSKNIEILFNSIASKIIGKTSVNQLEIKRTGKNYVLDIDGLFIQIGSKPDDQLIKNLKLKTDERGYIITDKESNTNVRGIFAAGDITNNKLKQIITSASEGAIAAKSAFDYLKS
ncbi:MAG: thioredoxin-disulfide reductase [Nanoarchaeota archaeon]